MEKIGLPDVEPDISVAVIQMAVIRGQKDKNVSRALTLAENATQKGVSLLVFPELCNTGYVFSSRGEMFDLAEEVTEGETVKRFLEMARDLRVYAIFGIAEKDGCRCYNSAVLVGPEGLIGVYRKLHLFDREKLFFEPGNLGLPIFDLPFGKLGLLICYDLRFFETSRLLMLKGADIICVPANWLVSFDRIGVDERGYAMQNYVSMVTANTNQVFIACANRIGDERGLRFFGKSMIAGPSGWLLAGPAPEEEEAVLIASVNLSEARTGKIKSNLNDIIRDRRTDVYGEMLGSRDGIFPF